MKINLHFCSYVRGGGLKVLADISTKNGIFFTAPLGGRGRFFFSYQLRMKYFLENPRLVAVAES